MPGQIVHIEIQADDTAKGREFWGRSSGGSSRSLSMGWFVTCKDTQGNEFGLWQSDPSAPASAPSA